MSKSKICVVGIGSWGFNHIKTLNELDVEISCVDENIDQIKKIKTIYPNIEHYSSLEKSFQNKVNGYIISTPPRTHFDLTKLILENNKPLLVEKPLTLSLKEAEKIKDIVYKNQSKLIVGHLLLFHPAFLKMKEIIDSGEIGKIKYMYSNRLNFGKVRNFENVLWSLAPHDISLFQFFAKAFPMKVQSSGIDFFKNGICDSVITNFHYPNQIKGHIFNSWIHPFKEHRFVISGTKGSIMYDDVKSKNHVSCFDWDILQEKHTISLVNNNTRKINFKASLPLKNELKYFLKVLKGESVSKANVDEGLQVIKILEIANKSLNIKIN